MFPTWWVFHWLAGQTLGVLQLFIKKYDIGRQRHWVANSVMISRGYTLSRGYKRDGFCKPIRSFANHRKFEMGRKRYRTANNVKLLGGSKIGQYHNAMNFCYNVDSGDNNTGWSKTWCVLHFLASQKNQVIGRQRYWAAHNVRDESCKLKS